MTAMANPFQPSMFIGRNFLYKANGMVVLIINKQDIDFENTLFDLLTEFSMDKRYIDDGRCISWRFQDDIIVPIQQITRELGIVVK